MYCVMNACKLPIYINIYVYIYIYSSFLQTSSVGGCSKLGSGEGKQVFRPECVEERIET
jgi:hypothetical protein